MSSQENAASTLEETWV